MDKITFFHCADLHLDTPFKTLAAKPGLPVLRRNEIFNNLTRMIEAVKKEKPDFLFIAGDLFEHEYSGSRTASAVNELFLTIPDTKVVMISGNHDPEAANSHYKTHKWGANVTFISGGTHSIYFEDNNTEIFGLGWVSGTGQASLLDEMDVSKDRINVLMFHGDVDLQIGDRDYNSISSQLLISKGFDYVAAGHNHKRKAGECGGIFYNPGSLEPLGFDEPGTHGFFSGNITKGEAPEINFRKNATVFYETIEFDISGYDNNENITESIALMLKPENILYKIVLNGSKSLDFSPDIALMEESFSDSALFAKVQDKSTVSVSIDELSIMKGLKGIFTRQIIEQMENADEEDKEILEKALYYGIEAIENGKIQRAGGEEL